MTDDERAEVLVTARLLRAASMLQWLAIALTIASGSSILVILLGVVAIYYGVRVTFDAKLFEDIAADRLTTAQLDSVLRLKKKDRPWPDRCRGARGLAIKLAIATLVQLIAVAAVRIASV